MTDDPKSIISISRSTNIISISSNIKLNSNNGSQISTASGSLILSPYNGKIELNHPSGSLLKWSNSAIPTKSGEVGMDLSTGRLRIYSGGSVRSLAYTDEISGTGGAPIGATYIVLNSDNNLNNERVLTAGNGISINDNGPGNNLVISSTVSNGAQGLQGTKGDIGLQGHTGPQGIPGTAAMQGDTGPQGAQGIVGLRGAQGIKGIQGVQGIQGTEGSTGLQGAIGYTGPQGLQGSTGLQGYTGPQGIPGTAVMQGDTGVQGIQGTAGIQGVKGNTGLQGIQGVAGLRGAQGIQGSQGTAGLRGIQGIQGSQGTQGATGFKGTQGSQGAQGTKGDRGVKGTQGVQGVQGSAGLKGTQGSQGAQGNSIRGSQGNSGTQGSIGSQGLTGPQGIQGAQAAAGAPSDASYLVLTSNSNLTNERVFTAGSGISISDSGPGAAFTISATGGGTGSGDLILIESKYISSNTQSIVFSNLDGDNDRNYYLLGRKIQGVNIATYEVRTNQSTSNLSSIYHFVYSNGSSTPGHITGNYSLSNIYWGVNSPPGSYGDFELVFNAQRSKPRMLALKTRYFTTSFAFNNLEVTGRWNNTSDNLTSLELRGSAADSFISGSEFHLYKLRRG